MGMIGRMTTVNGGVVIDTPDYSVEVHGPGYTNNIRKLVIAYASEGNIKVTVEYNGVDFAVHRFNGLDNTEYYWRRRFSKEKILNSQKYGRMGRICIKAMSDIFNM